MHASLFALAVCFAFALGEQSAQRAIRVVEPLLRPGNEQCPAQGLASGSTTVLEFNEADLGGTRYYKVYVGQNYNNTVPRPIHLTFHGLNDNCNDFMNDVNFNPSADSIDYILVAPCGSIGELGVAWNSGVCCGFLNTPNVPNDIKFAQMIVDHLATQVCIDKSRIYVSGFSNGGFMAETLACTLPGWARAAASVSGVVELRPGNDGGLAACDAQVANATRRTPVINIHGDLDLVVPWTGESVLGFPDIPTNMHRWAVRNQCKYGPNQTLNNPPFTNQVWSKCNGGTEIELVKNDGGGHEWPSGNGFDTTDYITKWFFTRNY